MVLDLPGLEQAGDYVVAVYASPAQPLLDGKADEQITVGRITSLHAVLYFGVTTDGR